MMKRILYILIVLFAVTEAGSAPRIENESFNKGSKVIKIFHIYDDGEENELNRTNFSWYIEEMGKELKKRDWMAARSALEISKTCSVKIKTHHLRIQFVVNVAEGESNDKEIYNRLKGDVVIGPNEMVELILANLE